MRDLFWRNFIVSYRSSVFHNARCYLSSSSWLIYSAMRLLSISYQSTSILCFFLKRNTVLPCFSPFLEPSADKKAGKKPSHCQIFREDIFFLRKVTHVFSWQLVKRASKRFSASKFLRILLNVRPDDQVELVQVKEISRSLEKWWRWWLSVIKLSEKSLT